MYQNQLFSIFLLTVNLLDTVGWDHQRKEDIIMTIKEIETATGLSRANIRYYEAEGLLNPQRQENGYRRYSETDVQTLLRIKLLRTLGVPIEALQRLHRGGVTLEEVLGAQQAQYAPQIDHLRLCGEVTGALLRAGERYDTLDPAPYLQMLETGDSAALQKDVVPTLNLPWRRYFARTLDELICLTPLLFLLPKIQDRALMFMPLVLSCLVMLVLEPLFLHLFRATPGKAIFGIQVTDPEGNRLSYTQALNRTFDVLLHGVAFSLPFLREYLCFKSLKACERGEVLPWEQDSEVRYKDAKNWRLFLFAAAYLLVFALAASVIWDHSGIEAEAQEAPPRFEGESPFYHIYRAEPAPDDPFESSEPLPIVHLLWNEGLGFFYGENTYEEPETIGNFEYLGEESPGVGLWVLRLGLPSNEEYQLRAGTESGITLSRLDAGQLKSRWLLSPIDTCVCTIRDSWQRTTTAFGPSWYLENTYSGDTDFVTIYSDSTLSMVLLDNPNALTVTEEYHGADGTEIQKIPLQPSETGVFTLSLPMKPPETHTVFRIPHGDGEYIFAVHYRK